MAVASVMRLVSIARTWIRVALGTPAIPRPSCPNVLSPAHQIVALLRSTHVKRRPGATSASHAVQVPSVHVLSEHAGADAQQVWPIEPHVPIVPPSVVIAHMPPRPPGASGSYL